MMLDLGETVNDISGKTGFSETTVRKRVKLLELDQEKFKESTAREVTLMEYMELFEIKDPELRNEVLESAGTENFKWELSRAKDKEKRKEWEKKITTQLDKFAVEVKEVGENFRCIKYYNDTAPKEDIEEPIKKPEDAGMKEYVYEVLSYGQIRLYREEEEITEEEIRKEEEENAKKAEREARVNEIKERSSKLREDFIYSLTNTKLMKHIGEILLLATEARTSFYMWESNYIEAFKLEVEEEDFEFDVIEEEMIKRPALSLLKIIYNQDLKNASYFNFRGEYSKDKRLDKLYDILGRVGYEMSEEEKQLQDGTHEIFNGEE